MSAGAAQRVDDPTDDGNRADRQNDDERQSAGCPCSYDADALATRPNRWEDLGRIACPTLLLWGAHDGFAPAADGCRMAGLIPNARYVEIAACGHLPSLEAPAEVIDSARHWLCDIHI